MTNDTLVAKLTSLCEKYIIASQYELGFEKRTKKEFITIINFLGYYFEEDEEKIFVKRSINSKSNIVELRKVDILREYEHWRLNKWKK